MYPGVGPSHYSGDEGPSFETALSGLTGGRLSPTMQRCRVGSHRYFALPTRFAQGGRAGASEAGGRRGRPMEPRESWLGGQSLLRIGLGLEGALAPDPGGPGGGEPTGLIHIQNLEGGGDRESPKLMQVS